MSIDANLVARARSAAKALSELSPRIEAARRLPPEAVEVLAKTGIFKWLVPKVYGGEEASPATMVAAFEEIAAGDGSAGWCAMINGTSALMSVFLDDETARAVYGPADAISCGVFAPMGRAVRVDGGFRVSGRWPFASGCEHSAWRMGGAIVEGDAPLPGGVPNVQSMLFPASDTQVHDTWDTAGLRGTGSHDIEVRDVFVPASRSFSLITDAPRHGGPAYAVPFFGMLAASVASVSLGIGRAAVDAFVALAKSKRTLGAKKTLAHREVVQLQVARAEAKLRAARAFLHGALEDAGRDPSPRARAILRLAATHAAAEAAGAVDIAYELGGGTAIYMKNPLQRYFRDVHVITQHIMVSPTSTTTAGRILLDVETDLSTL